MNKEIYNAILFYSTNLFYDCVSHTDPIQTSGIEYIEGFLSRLLKFKKEHNPYIRYRKTKNVKKAIYRWDSGYKEAGDLERDINDKNTSKNNP